jgi:7-cyano-7-deazaguanine synthase
VGKAKYVLWSGGWDSTFRVIQLYKRGITLQPIYIVDSGRASYEKEIETIQSLSSQIESKFENSEGEILPVKFIQKENIPTNIYYRIIHKIIKWRRGIGKQYYWLACLAKEYEGLEQGFHREDRDCLIYFHELTEIIDETGKNWVANPKKMNFFKSQLFKKIKFPLMYISKQGMKEFAEKNGFIDIMNNTWFCHTSSNKACGKCNPCKQYVIDGLGYRLK